MAHPAPDTLALVALGEDVDDAAIEHFATCRACFAEIEALQQVVSVGRSLAPDDRLLAPHPRVWQRISSDVADGRVIPLPGAVMLQDRPPVVPPAATEPVPLGGLPPSGDQSARPSRPRGRRRWLAVTLAAGLALIVGLGGGYVVRGVLNPVPDVVGATQLNALPQWPGANGTASVEKSTDGQQTLVVAMEMPPNAQPGGTLEVWMSDSRATDMVPVGTMTGVSGRFALPASVDVATHPIIDVSLEPADDSDPTHSDVSVVRGRLKL